MKRRAFLKRSAAGTIATATPLVLSRTLAGAAPAGERVSMAWN